MNRLSICFLCLSILVGGNAFSQKIYREYQKKAYASIAKVLDTRSPDKISNVSDQKACAMVALWRGDYELAITFFENALQKDSASFSSDDYVNYAFALLEGNKDSELFRLESTSTVDNQWLAHMQEIARFRQRVDPGKNKTLKVDTLHVAGFLNQYGISYVEGNVYFSSGSQLNKDEQNNFESRKLRRRWEEFTSIDYLGLKTNDIEEVSLRDFDFSKRIRLATFYKDTLNQCYFFTKVPLNGNPEGIIIRGNLDDFPFNSKQYACAMPWYDTKNRLLYFCSDMPGGVGGWDIYTSKWENNEWQPPVNLRQVNTPFDEIFPTGSPWGGLLFASNAHKGFGGFDNYLYHIKAEKIYNLVDFNSEKDDYSLVFLLHEKVIAAGVCDSVALYYKAKAVGTIITCEDLKMGYGDSDEAYLTIVEKTENSFKPETVTDTNHETEPTPELKTVNVNTNNSIDEEQTEVLDSDSVFLYYDEDKYSLADKEKQRLDAFVQRVKATGAKTIFIKGSADETGTSKYNDYISYQRANSVKSYLSRELADIEFQLIVQGEQKEVGFGKPGRRNVEAYTRESYTSEWPVLLNYNIKNSETIESVASLFNCSIESLLKINQISKETGYLPKQIWVPIQAVYKVKPDQNLYRISLNHNCKIDDVLRVNNKSNDHVLVNEILVIPVMSR